ncbi:MAG TPA: DUF3800 domain-containing protein [Methylovirgula sp.]|nr:DUF3800 domain-containing protein [Methylovirgula sp.]
MSAIHCGVALIPARTADSSHEILARLIEILAPGDGDLVAFLECYFDESGSHDGSPVLSVGGYLFEKEQCKALDLEWKAVLDFYRLPYFRMSACAHNQEPFDHLSPQECIDAEKAVITLINQYALLGLGVIVNEADYNTWFEGQNSAGTAYSFCCWQILAGIRTWIIRNQFQGEIAYFFEAGHASKPEANALMHRIFSNPQLRAAYRYVGHSFVDKEKVRPVQTADILAWQQATQMKRWLKNDHRMRKDFQALTAKPQHELFIGNRQTVGGVIAYQRSLQGLPVLTGLTGHFGKTWFWCPFDGAPGASV